MAHLIGRIGCTLACLLVTAIVRADTAPAATVNGDVITMDDWIGRMQNLRAQNFLISASPMRLNDAITAGQLALTMLINERLVLQYAAKTGLMPTDAEVDADVQNAKKQAQVQQALEKKLFTEDQLRRDARIQRALYNVATINHSVSADEVKAYYDKHPEMWGQPERWQLAMIRVTGQAAADKVSAELKSGKAFATVAAELSEDTSTKANGGDIGTVAAADPRLPEYVREAVRKLKLGEVTPPLRPPNPAQPMAKPVFLFVQLVGKQEATMKPFDQAKDQAERLALLEKSGGQAAAEKKMDEFRKTSTIVINLPGYQDLFKK